MWLLPSIRRYPLFNPAVTKPIQLCYQLLQLWASEAMVYSSHTTGTALINDNRQSRFRTLVHNQWHGSYNCSCNYKLGSFWHWHYMVCLSKPAVCRINCYCHTTTITWYDVIWHPRASKKKIASGVFQRMDFYITLLPQTKIIYKIKYNVDRNCGTNVA